MALKYNSTVHYDTSLFSYDGIRFVPTEPGLDFLLGFREKRRLSDTYPDEGHGSRLI